MADFNINFEVKKTGEAKIEIDGNPVALLAGVLVLIKSIIQNMYLNGGEDDMKWFTKQIAEALTNPEHTLYEEVYEGVME